MAKLIVSTDVYIGGEISTGIDEGLIEFKGGRNLGQLPTLYDGKGIYVEPVNNWFIYLVSAKRLEDLGSYSRALKRYWDFLERKKLAWNKFPPIKGLKPTYIFRNDDLLKNAKEGHIAYSTANTYMCHVVSFYLWAAYEGYYSITENHKPFEIEFVKVKSNNILAHMMPKFTVQTSDLRIRVPKDSFSKNIRKLSPLPSDMLKNLSLQLYHSSHEIRFICLLAAHCGLRIEEASGFTLKALNQAVPRPDSRTHYEITIGPQNGVPTKYNKTRTIEITSKLLMELKNYSISERRLNRLDKLIKNITELLKNNYMSTVQPQRMKKERRELFINANRYEPLFISQQGNPYSPKTVSTRFGDIRHHMVNIGISFTYKFHDLRCSYATYRLQSLLAAGLEPASALDLLMQWMGHKDESTTWKYLSYLNRKEALKDKISMLDNIMHQALKEFKNE